MHRSDYRKRKELGGVSGEELRRALRHFASGVTVVTAESDGVRYGITVSSFASISLDPPIIMVSLSNSSQLVEMVLRSEHFAVHILATHQEELSQRFAAPYTAEEKFAGIVSEPGASGAPTLGESLAVLDCVLDQSLAVGTHTVMFGRVVHTRAVDESGDPLLYYHRRYRKLAE